MRTLIVVLLAVWIVHAQDSTDKSTACRLYNECNEAIIFSDNFDELNTRRWKHEITLGGSGNWEFQAYVNNRTVSYAKDGSLHIHPRLSTHYHGVDITNHGFTVDLWNQGCTNNAFYGCSRTTNYESIVNPITSARISTSNSFSFKYGRMEVRAKLPLGDWIWPAIWLLPQDDHWGSWPQSGEIDIMEARGNQNYDGVVHQGGSDSFGSTLHWGPYYAENGYALTHKKYKLERGELSDDYHIYGMYWDKKKLVTYIDSPSNVVLNVSMTESLWEKANQAGYGWTQKQYSKPWEGATPFDQEFNIVLNVAVGGTNGYFPDVGAKPWRNGASAANQFWNQRNKWLPSWKNDQVAMKIDYVKVWSNDDTMYTRK